MAAAAAAAGVDAVVLEAVAAVSACGVSPSRVGTSTPSSKPS